MDIKKSDEPKINIFDEYRKLNLKPWQYPHALFGVFGVIIIAFVYLIAPIFFLYQTQAIIFTVVVMAALLFIFGYLVVSSFNLVVRSKSKELEFVDIAAHQLRTPLSGVKWTLELLERKFNAGGEDKYVGIESSVQAMHEASVKMFNTMDTLLQMGRIERGAVVFNREPFSLVSLTEGEINSFRSFVENQKILLDFKFGRDLPNVLADKVKTTIVLQNLMENALVYSPQSSTISIGIERKDKDFLVWSVTDRGIGIPEGEKQFIFQKFFRASNAKSKQATGSGIGLYIAKTIIEMSGGEIGVESPASPAKRGEKEGKGSMFWFTLPVAK